MRKVIVLFFGLLFLLFSLCAEDSISFKLTHFVGNPNSKGNFEFWLPGSRDRITSANVSSYSSLGRFATLGVRYSGTFQIASLEITFSDLQRFTVDENNQKTKYSDYCPYELFIYDAKATNSLLIDPSDYGSTTGRGGASVVIFSNGKNWSTLSEQEADTVADFYISVNDSTAVAGTYEGTITVTIGGQ